MSDGELPASGVPHGGVYARAAAFPPPSRRRLRPGRNNPFGNNPFVREPYPFHGHPGQEVLMVRFFGPDGEMVLHCYVHDLYDGEQMRPEKLETWRGLRERYGNRDESRVDQGTLLAPAA